MEVSGKVLDFCTAMANIRHNSLWCHLFDTNGSYFNNDREKVNAINLNKLTDAIVFSVMKSQNSLDPKSTKVVAEKFFVHACQHQCKFFIYFNLYIIYIDFHYGITHTNFYYCVTHTHFLI